MTFSTTCQVFHRASFVGYPYGAASGNDPDEVLMGNLETPLVRQIDREGLERRPLSSLSRLFCCHVQIIAERLPNVQPAAPLTKV